MNKKVMNKLKSAYARLEKIQEEIDEIRCDLEAEQSELDDEEPKDKKKFDKLQEELEYCDDAYYALDAAMTALDEYIE